MAETADIYFAQFDDCDLLDFHDSTAECSELEPMPNFASSNDSAVDNAEYPQAIATVAAAVAVLNKVDHQIEHICNSTNLSSEQKSDLIRYASRKAGYPLDNNRIVQKLLEHHSKAKYGSDLIVINKDQGSEWFDNSEYHIIDNLIVKGELNIVGGLSGAAKTIFVSQMIASVLNHKRESTFLGFRVHRHLVQSVFFIGLDGGRNVYTPIFRNTGLVDEHGAIAGFNFIPNESGWGVSSSNLDKLEDQLKTKPDTIVVVDSLLAAISTSGVDENSPLLAARIMDLKLVCEKYGATPIVLAHQKKESTQDFTGADSLRGHGSIPAFAGQVITLNFLDQKSKVNGKAVPDRKNPKRRLVAGHRGTPIDLLVELNFDEGTVTNHGDFYDALFAMQASADAEEADEVFSIQSVINGFTRTQREVLEALLSYEEPIAQATLISDYEMSKGTVSKAIKALLDKTFLGSRLVSEIETHNGKVYEVPFAIRNQLGDLKSDY